MKKVIQHLKKLEEKYESDKKAYESDLKYGLKKEVRKYFDPVMYDKEEHEEVVTAISILSKYIK